MLQFYLFAGNYFTAKEKQQVCQHQNFDDLIGRQNGFLYVFVHCFLPIENGSLFRLRCQKGSFKRFKLDNQPINNELFGTIFLSFVAIICA